MRRTPPPVSPLATIIMTLLAIVLVVLMIIVLRRGQDLRSVATTAADRAISSSLLPVAHWKTYVGSVWSMGYPEDWQLIPSKEGLSFVDPYTATSYLTVSEVDSTLAEVAIYYQDNGSTKSEFLFAGYPANKFTLPSGEQDYFVAYKDRIIKIITEYPDDQKVGIMLVTFQFLN